MIIKNITKKPISATATILSFKKGDVVPIKINKSIEIVVVPNLGDLNAHQDNVGIILEEEKILKILSKRYKNVSITKVNSEEDLEKMVIRKPDLVFSGVKYFYFNNICIPVIKCLFNKKNKHIVGSDVRMTVLIIQGIVPPDLPLMLATATK